MQASSYYSDATNPADAAVEVGIKLRADGFGPQNNHGSALVFASRHLAEHPRALSGALRDALGDIPFLGWVGTSVFHNSDIEEGTPGLSVLRFPNDHSYIRHAAQSRKTLGSEIAAELLADSPTGRLRFLSASNEGFDANNLFPCLDEQNTPVLGLVSHAVLSSDQNQDAFSEQSSVALMTMTGYQALTAVAQGARPLGPQRQVTAVDRNFILEIDHRPALESLLTDLPARLHQQLSQLRGLLYAGLSSQGQEAFLMRNIVGIDPRTGAVAVEGSPRSQTPLVFSLRCGKASRRDLDASIETLAKGLGDRKPTAILVFNCAGRNADFFGVPLHDVESIQSVLGTDCPIVGASGFGEIATFTNYTHLFGYTAAIVALIPDE